MAREDSRVPVPRRAPRAQALQTQKRPATMTARRLTQTPTEINVRSLLDPRHLHSGSFFPPRGQFLRSRTRMGSDRYEWALVGVA